jgi:DNA-directed RNA polymerase specialized sigma24 family protein
VKYRPTAEEWEKAERFCIAWAGRYASTGRAVGLSMHDLVDAARDGLVAILASYDPTGGGAFCTAAYRRIQGAVQNIVEQASGRAAKVHLLDTCDEFPAPTTRQLEFRRAMARLPKHQQELVLAALGGRTLDWAEKVGMTSTGCYKVYRKAVAQLKEELAA